jgi:hypothetical protein
MRDKTKVKFVGEVIKYLSNENEPTIRWNVSLFSSSSSTLEFHFKIATLRHFTLSHYFRNYFSLYKSTSIKPFHNINPKIPVVLQ